MRSIPSYACKKEQKPGGINNLKRSFQELVTHPQLASELFDRLQELKSQKKTAEDWLKEKQQGREVHEEERKRCISALLEEYYFFYKSAQETPSAATNFIQHHPRWYTIIQLLSSCTIGSFALYPTFRGWQLALISQIGENATVTEEEVAFWMAIPFTAIYGPYVAVKVGKKIAALVAYFKNYNPSFGGAGAPVITEVGANTARTTIAAIYALISLGASAPMWLMDLVGIGGRFSNLSPALSFEAQGPFIAAAVISEGFLFLGKQESHIQRLLTEIVGFSTQRKSAVWKQSYVARELSGLIELLKRSDKNVVQQLFAQFSRKED